MRVQSIEQLRGLLKVEFTGEVLGWKVPFKYMRNVNAQQVTKVDVIPANEALDKEYLIVENLKYVNYGKKRSERYN